MMLRCHWCPDAAPAPATDLVTVATPGDTYRPYYACPACVDDHRLQPLPTTVGALTAALSAVLLAAQAVLAHEHERNR